MSKDIERISPTSSAPQQEIGRTVSQPLVGVKRSVLRNRTLLAVSLTVFAAYTGIGMVTPVRVLYAQSRGASLTVIGLMASAYLVSNFLFQYPTGWLADRWGRKQVMIIGLAMQAVITLLYLLTSDPITFIVLRFVEGIAGAALLPPARALIIDAIPSEQQGEAYGTFGAFFSAGFLLGPGIGGLFAASGYLAAFIGAVVFRLIAIVLVVTMIHSDKKGSSKETQEEPISYRAIFTLPLLGAYILAFGDYLFLGLDTTILPLWMHDNLGAPVFMIGLAYVTWALPTTIFSPIGGRIADHARRWLMIFIFGLAQVPLYIAYGLLNSAILVVLLFGVHGVVYSFIQPAVDAHVAKYSLSTMRARVQGMYTTIGLIGSFIGATGFTQFYRINYRYPWFAMGICYGVFLLIGGTMIYLSEKRKVA